LGCKFKIIAVLVAVAFLLPALATYAKEEPKEILIGTAVSLTGKESVAGVCTNNAYKLAIKEVNDRGGIEIQKLGHKLPVRLIVYDDESNPEKSASLIERLIIEDKVDVLLGGMTTPIVKPQTEVAEKYHIPFISGSGAASHIYSKGYRWIFTVCPSIECGAITLMEFIREQQEEGNLPKSLKIAMVWEDTSHGKDFQNGVHQQVGKFPDNFKIVLDKSFPWMAMDFIPLLNEVKEANADIFLSDVHEADFMLMHRQYIKLGLSHLLVSYGARGSEEIAREKLGPAVDYLVSMAWWSKDTPYPQVKKFINNYEITYSKPPEWYAGTPYEAARALLQAIKNAGSLNKAKIRDALAYLDLPNSTVVGQHLSFRENGQADYPLLITQNRPDGTSPIVYPTDTAIAKATIPRPRIWFGCALSLSGELKKSGNLYKEGYELWKDRANSQGGILISKDRYLIDIIYYDDESNPQKTASLVEKLITQDKVNFLLGPYGSNCTFEAAAVAEKYRVPMVQGGGAAEKIFTQGFKYTFGLLSPAGDYFKNILEGAASLYPEPNRVVIVSADDIFSLSTAQGAKQHAKRLGFEIISFITFENKAELPSILSALKGDDPNIVLFSAHFEEALSFVRIAKTVGFSPEMFGITVAPSDPAFIKELGKDANYIFGTTQWTSNLPYYGPVSGSSEDYAQFFQERFGKEPDYHSAAATACGAAYQLALEKASSLDCEKVKESLASLDNMTFYGRIKFNEQGRDIYNPMVAIQIQKGKRVTVWPNRFATGSVIYPTPPWEEREPVLKIAVLHIGPIGDYGWTYEAHLGAQRMADTLPYVELSEKENACGPDTSQILREYAKAG